MDAKKYKRDAITYLVFLALSLLVYFVLIPSQISISAWNTSTVFTAQTYPKLVAIIIFGASVIGFLKNYVLYVKLKKESSPDVTKKNFKMTAKNLTAELMPVFIMLVAVIYYILFNRFGYIVSTALLLPAVLAILKCKKWQYYVYCFVFCAILYVIFVFVLKVQLP